MGNRKSRRKTEVETLALLPKRTYKVYSENLSCKCTIELHKEHMCFKTEKDHYRIRTIPYNEITEMSLTKLWPGICKRESILYVATAHQGQLWFTGKHASSIEKCLQDFRTEI